MLSAEKLNENYVKFIAKLNELSVNTDQLVDYLGSDSIMNGVAAPNLDSGLAYDGSLIQHIFYRVTKYAVNINNMLQFKVNQESLVKVCLLHQIAKVLMFEENDNAWEKTNRGIVYKYTELEGALRCGERSAYICMKCGIDLSYEEYEAMKVLDRDSDDKYAKFFSSPIAVIVKQANELAYMEAKQVYKASTNK